MIDHDASFVLDMRLLDAKACGFKTAAVSTIWWRLSPGCIQLKDPPDRRDVTILESRTSQIPSKYRAIHILLGHLVAVMNMGWNLELTCCISKRVFTVRKQCIWTYLSHISLLFTTVTAAET